MLTFLECQLFWGNVILKIEIMKIFITGATGFIGKQVIRIVSESEHEVVCLVRKSSMGKEHLRHSKIRIVEGDVRNKQSVLEGMKGCDWVFHIAGHYSFWEPDDRIYREINVTGTTNVMECALENKVSKVVHVSTILVFGNPLDEPFNEKSEPGRVRFSTYAQTKFEGDQIVMNFYKHHGLPVVIIYPCSVCGEGDPKPSGKYVSDLINKRLPATVLHDATLTFVHVNDVAQGIVRAAQKPDNLGEKYILGKDAVNFQLLNQWISEISGVSLPKLYMPDALTMFIAKVFTLLSKLTGESPPWGMSVDQMKTMREGVKADGSKAERELGFTYTPFRKALEEKIAAEIRNR